MTRVISYSLYGERREHVLGAVINCLLAPSLYPGWICRFHVDETVPRAILARLESFEHVELRPMPRHTNAPASLWRYLAAADEHAEAVVFRDAGSWLSARDGACVEAWLASGRDFHLIRDHGRESEPIVPGAWGVRGRVLADIGEWIAEWRATGATDAGGFLADWVYPLTIGRAVVHRADCRDHVGAPVDHLRDGAIPIPAHDDIDEPVAGLSWLEARHLNAVTCSRCGEEHAVGIGTCIETIPARALAVLEGLAVDTAERATLERERPRKVGVGGYAGGCGFDVLCLGDEDSTRWLARGLADAEHRVFLLRCGREPAAGAVELAANVYEVQLPAEDPARPQAQIAALSRLLRDAAIHDACVIVDAASTSAAGALALTRQLAFRLVCVGEDADGVACDLALGSGEAMTAQDALRETLAGWHPRAAIVIVSFGNPDYLATTLESLFASTRYPNFEVIVVDNGSGAELIDYLEGYAAREPRLRLIRNGANLGFARACNLGIAAAAGAERIVLLNDDVVVSAGWLGGLLRLLGDERTGLVGPVTNHARGQARIEVSYEDLGDIDAFAAARAREHRGEMLELPVLAMFCVAARAEVLARVGALDERFTIGMYEDDDYALRLRRAGYRLLCARDVYVHHWGGASFRQLEPAAHDAVHATHRAAFEEKWGISPAEAELAAGPAAAGSPDLREGGRTAAFAAHLARRFGGHVPIARPGDDLRRLLEAAPAVLVEGGDPGLLRRLILAAGGSDAFVGDTLAVALPAPLERRAPDGFRVQAYVPAFNEADIIEATVGHLLRQGVDVHVLDNHSSDGTWEICERLAAEDGVSVERFGSSRHYDWSAILGRIEELAGRSDADWLMMLDADELRVAPWPEMSLRDALWAVDRAGFNAVDHTVLHFPPTDELFRPGADPREHFRFVELWTGPGYEPQIKAWKAGPWRARLIRTGGHEAEFDERRVFPFNFLDEHYPLRSQRHAEQKVFRERVPRWSPTERGRGWHAQYDDVAPGHRFLRSRSELERYDPATFARARLPECLARVGLGADAPRQARRARGAEVSVVYVTHRLESHFEWFAAAFADQIDGEDVEVVLVDGLHSIERGERFARAAAGRFPLRHVPAKPTPYNGPHRVTRGEYFAPASARNTGIVHAERPYIVFVDDVSLPMPGWWRAATRAARDSYVVAGAYQKHREMAVRDGRLQASRLDGDGLDSRWSVGSDEGIVAIGGGALYGCSVGMPRRLLVDVNGFDELCDAIAGEDGQLGYRLQHAEVPIYYDRRMLTIESVEAHDQTPRLERLRQVAHPALYMARLREFGVHERWRPGAWDNEHMIFDLVRGRHSTASLGNPWSLGALAPRDLEATAASFPQHHWFDQRPLAEL